ncbi:MAG: FecR domain-containing protein [Anaerolineae bacterium]|nr:FecR domain-containing protein [Anaerolineae bacterium]
MLTGNTATALISVRPPESEQTLATFQVYSNTDFHLMEAETPRFGVSNHGRMVMVRLDNGRLRLNLNEDEARPFTVRLVTPQGELEIVEPGQYAVVVTPEDTQVTVQTGEADILAAGEVLRLLPESRARIPTGSPPLGPLGTERNLIAMVTLAAAANSGF